jgi:hypothetical protein
VENTEMNKTAKTNDHASSSADEPELTPEEMEQISGGGAFKAYTPPDPC